MSWFARVHKPWLHFVVLGLVFYQLQSSFQASSQASFKGSLI